MRLGCPDVKTPPTELAGRLLDVGEQVLHADPPLRLEDVAHLVGASRASLYYYFSGRDDLLTFLLTAHTRRGAEAVQAAVDPDDPPAARLTATVDALVGYLGLHPGLCAGLLGALGNTGRMSEVLHVHETWITGPLRQLLAEGRKAGPFTGTDDTDTEGTADAANAVIGALLLAVLGRSLSGTDPTDPLFRARLTAQAVQGVLARR